MKKMLALFLSFVLVFAFAGCSAKYNVFKEIEQKSKRFDVNLSFDSIEVVEETVEYGLTAVGGAGEDFVLIVNYDSEEYKTSSHPKIIYLSYFSEKDITSSDDEKTFLNTCKSILLIDEWGLTIEDIEELEMDCYIYVETKSGETLEIKTDSEMGMLAVYREEALTSY